MPDGPAQPLGRSAMNVRIAMLLVGTLSASLGAVTPAVAAPPDKGYIMIDGMMGPSKAKGHEGWFELASSDIAVEAGVDKQCTAVAEAFLEYGAPKALLNVGTTIPEVRIELTSEAKGGQTYYKARLTDVNLNKAVSSFVRGNQVERLEMSMGRVRLEVKKQNPDGTFSQGGETQFDCADGGRG